MSESTRPVHPWVAAGTEQVRFAVTSGLIPDHRLMRDEIRYLEGLGFDAVFLPDHPLAVMGDPWLTLAGCVDATTSIRLGVMVSCVAYRHPAMLARAAADVDRMSDGRAILGLGSGDMPPEFAMLGLDWGTPRTRRERLEQTLRVMPKLLRGEPVTYEGTGFALHDAALPMPAVQEPHVPIVVAGGSRGSLRLAAEHADAVNLGAVAWAGGAFSTDDVSAKLATLDEFAPCPRLRAAHRIRRLVHCSDDRRSQSSTGAGSPRIPRILQWALLRRQPGRCRCLPPENDQCRIPVPGVPHRRPLRREPGDDRAAGFRGPAAAASASPRVGHSRTPTTGRSPDQGGRSAGHVGHQTIVDRWRRATVW
jgi:alkanesulfonate monooxygenase SsuD/methylene tetrahydromethanopterin reductase-like flavin-dependent oxidoreductase (luciferase family)